MLECQHICLSLSIFQIIWSYLKHSINLKLCFKVSVLGTLQWPIGVDTRTSTCWCQHTNKLPASWCMSSGKFHLNSTSPTPYKLQNCFMSAANWFLTAMVNQKHTCLSEKILSRWPLLYSSKLQYLPWISKSNKLGLIVIFTPTCKVKPHPEHISCIICLFRL